MGSIRKVCAAFLLALLCLLSGAGESAPPADPEVWGVYAQLVGTQWTGKPDSGRGTDRWRWGEDAGSIIESGVEWGGRYIIKPGPVRGTLTKDFSRGVHHFRGTIAPDGSVLWIRKGMIKNPHRISLVGGELREESGLKLQDDQVVAVKHVSRFEQSGGAPVAGAGAGAGSAAEAGVVAGRVDTPATTHGDPAQAKTDATTAPANLPAAGASAQELEAAAAALLERASAQREAEAAVQERAQLTAALATQREAEAAATQAEQVLAKAVAARAELEPAAARSSGSAKGDYRDWWTYCSYTVLSVRGDPTHRFITNLIHQRMYAPYKGPAEEYEAYTGPNRQSDVEDRFMAAMKASGLLPGHQARGGGCSTLSTREDAEEEHADSMATRDGISPVQVTWRRLEDTRLASGGQAVPSAEAVAALERTAAEARTRADAASLAAEQLASTQQQCRDVPRVVKQASGFRASRQEAELRVREVVARACGVQGIAGEAVLSCRAHDTSLDVEIGPKGQVQLLPDAPDQWVCNADATCVATRQVCEPRSTEKGSSAQ